MVQFEELSRIGNEEGPDEFLISSAFRSTPVGIGPDGQIGYIERRPTELRAYHSDGTFSFSAGGRGEGPGEWRVARTLQFIEDTGWAIIASPYRLVLFDKEGLHLDTKSVRDLPGGPFPSLLHFLPDGRLWYWSQDTIRFEDYFGHLYWGNWRTIEAQEVLTTRLGVIEVRGDVGYSTRFPFSYDVDVAGKAWINHKLDYEVEVLDPAVQTQWRLKRDYRMFRNPDHNREFREEEWSGDMTSGKKMWGNPPEYFPAIKGIKWVTEDELWIFTSTYIDTPLVQIDVFNPDGEYLRALKADESLRWAQFQGDTVWQLLENEDGIPQFVRSRYWYDKD